MPVPATAGPPLPSPVLNLDRNVLLCGSPVSSTRGWLTGRAVVVALVGYALLPQSLLFTGRLVIPVLEVVLLLALLVTNPRRMTRQTRFSRWASIGVAAVVIGTRLGALEHESQWGNLLLAAMQIWVTKVIGCAAVLGAAPRLLGRTTAGKTRRDGRCGLAFLPRRERRHRSRGEPHLEQGIGGVPIFVDYLSLSVTNSSAFSPTDSMPLTSRAKVLMAVQATAALVTS